MTVQVQASENIEAGIEAIKAASIEDYNQWSADHSNEYNVRDNMRKEFAEGFSHTVGQKYIKMIVRSGDRPSVYCFIVAVDSDSKFRRGDVLKPAGWNTPARNKPRGNVFDGDFPVRWTGPLYL